MFTVFELEVTRSTSFYFSFSALSVGFVQGKVEGRGRSPIVKPLWRTDGSTPSSVTEEWLESTWSLFVAVQ